MAFWKEPGQLSGAVSPSSPDDYHHDHRIVSDLVHKASFMATLPNIETEFVACESVSPIYYMDTLAGHGFNPTEYVDISNTFLTKQNMLACHKSQLEWLEEHDGEDMLEFVHIVAKARGYQAGVQYAEGFRLAQTWSRTPPRRLLP